MRHVAQTARLSAPSRGPSSPTAARRAVASCRSTSLHSSAMISPQPQPGFAAQQHDQIRLCDSRFSAAVDKPLVFLEVVKPHRRLRIGSSRCVHGIRSMTSHSTAFFSSDAQHRQHVVDGLRRPLRQRVLQLLDVLVRDRVQPLVPSNGTRCTLQDGLLRGDPARLLPIRPRVAVEEPRRELFKCGHLLLGLRQAVLQQVPLTVLAPSLRGRLGARWSIADAPGAGSRSSNRVHHVHHPAALSIRSDCYAHRCLPFQRWRGLLAEPV